MSSVVCRVVEVCVFRFVQDRPEYLLLRRSRDEKVYPGLWQIITGVIAEDEKAIDAAIRELKEETALVPRRFWVVPHVSTFYNHHDDTVNFAPLFAAQVEPGDEPVLSSEHLTYQWMEYDEARQRLVLPGHRECLDIIHTYLVAGEEAGTISMVPV